MHNASYRDLPLAALIAIAGATLGAIVLVLPWYSIDAAGVAWVGKGMPFGVSPDESLAGSPGVFTQLIVEGAKPLQKGWRVEPTSWALFREVAAVLAILAAAKMIRDRAAGPLQRITFLVAVVVFAASPYPYLFMKKGPKFEAVHNIAAAPYLSLVAAGLMLVALVLADRFRGAEESTDGPGAPSVTGTPRCAQPPSVASSAPPGFGI